MKYLLLILKNINMDRHIEYHIIHSNINLALPIKEVNNYRCKLSLEKLHICINAKETAATRLDICKQKYENYFRL